MTMKLIQKTKYAIHAMMRKALGGRELDLNLFPSLLHHH
jgi:hypothetical protein